MYKKSGPRTDPWMTTNVTVARLKSKLFIEKYCFLFERYDLKHSFATPLVP